MIKCNTMIKMRFLKDYRIAKKGEIMSVHICNVDNLVKNGIAEKFSEAKQTKEVKLIKNK